MMSTVALRLQVEKLNHLTIMRPTERDEARGIELPKEPEQSKRLFVGGSEGLWQPNSFLLTKSPYSVRCIFSFPFAFVLICTTSLRGTSLIL